MIHAREDYNRIQDPDGKIKEDEPVILFRAQDELMVQVLEFYSFIARRAGAHDVSRKVNDHVVLAKEWQRRNPTKVPDW